jgi:hypothetical protein
MRMVKKTTTTKQKAKYGAGACRPKVWVYYYDEFKVIF